MTRISEADLKRIGDAIKSSCDSSYKQGLYEGLLVAVRIRNLYALNHQLAEMVALETLNDWAQSDLIALAALAGVDADTTRI